MLLAVGPNPTIDRTLHVPDLTVGTVHRATRVELGAGGKGLNVTRVARTLGHEAVTTGPLSGHSGRLLADLTRAEGLAADWHWLADRETRSTTLINRPGGDATVINEPGPAMSAGDWAGFADHVTRLAQAARVVAFCGSVLPGLVQAALADLARSLVAAERAVYVDTSSAALVGVLARPVGLCIKVNRAELAAGLGIDIDGLSDERLHEAGQQLLARGASRVVVTQGAEGAIAITPEGSWQAAPPPVKVASTVGSGDSMLAGLALAILEGQDTESALAFGVACGAANALTALPGRLEAETVRSLRKQVRSSPFLL